ncbi:MAG: RibD family protein [Culicoidibacterales bacterium]
MLPITDLPNTAKLQLLFSKPIRKQVGGIIDPIFESIYQENLFFSEIDQTRPITYGCFVTSIDGRIAFPDNPKGPLIAKLNQCDHHGAALDWWLLNALRTSCDGLIFGVNTLVQEPELTGHIYDWHLQAVRLNQKQQKIPWNIIMTRNHQHIPWTHKTFQTAEIPLIIVTTAHEFEACCHNLTLQGREVVRLETAQTLDEAKTYVIPRLDEGLLAVFQLFKQCGLNKVLVESPTVCHALIEAELLDELFITQSGVYIGGESLTIGQTQRAFTSEKHPHTQLISLHQHGTSFLYFRYRFKYQI